MKSPRSAIARLYPFDYRGRFFGVPGGTYTLPRQKGSSADLRTFTVTVDKVEEITGLDFFSSVPQPEQEELGLDQAGAMRGHITDGSRTAHGHLY